MDETGEVRMSIKETDRYAVIKRVLNKDLGQAQAAKQLNLSVRQIKRLCRAKKEVASNIPAKFKGLPLYLFRWQATPSFGAATNA